MGKYDKYRCSLTCGECGHKWYSMFDDDECPECNPPPDKYDENHVHVPSYSKGYDDGIKKVEEWMVSIRDSRPKDDGKSIEKFIHKKCVDSPLNDISSITDVVGLMTEFYHLPMMSMFILREAVELEKLRRDKNG